MSTWVLLVSSRHLEYQPYVFSQKAFYDIICVKYMISCISYNFSRVKHSPGHPLEMILNVLVGPIGKISFLLREMLKIQINVESQRGFALLFDGCIGLLHSSLWTMEHD